MKIWYDSDGKGAGGRKYYAVVEELMVDKDGKPVYTPAPSYVPAEPQPQKEPEVVAPVEVCETPSESANEQVVYVDDDALIDIISEVSRKIDVIINYLGTGERKVIEDVPVEVEEEVALTQEPVAEETEEPVVSVAPVAPVEVAPEEGEKKPVHRSPNFAEKMHVADEILQDRYDELKNYALRFRKLKSRISKKFDSINQGRLQFVKLSVAGKTLKLYLNMDAKDTEPKFHCKDVSDKKTYVTVPTLLRIKSGRAVKYAKILIDQCAEQHGMLERRKPFEVDAMALIDEALLAKQDHQDDAVDVVEAETAVTEE